MIIEKVVNGALQKKKVFDKDILFYTREGWKVSKDKELPAKTKTFEKKVEDSSEDSDFEPFKKKK